MSRGGSGQHDDRQRVLDATDIVALVGEHLRLSPRGREYVGLCPFHDDRKPSLYVVPSKQIYHCFACGAGGNALDFMIQFHKMEFLDALRHLADRSGVELTPRTAPGEARDGARGNRESASRAEILAANALALDFFRLILRHPDKGGPARREIEKRGFSDATVDRFQLGAAPEGWDALLTAARRRNIPASTLLHAGLLKPGKEGRGEGYDSFRHRLMFPICDSLGRVIAFGGRTLRDEDEPKYLNSPESVVFEKSCMLYGLHLASQAIQKLGRAVVTEGYTDTIACHQAGFENVVATLGTALTARHARALQRLCGEIVLVFDGDDAGAKAADRAIEVFFSQPVDVKIVVLPPGVDPADLLALEDGAVRFREALDGAVDALDYRFTRLRQRLAGTGLSERAKRLDEEVARLVGMGLDQQPILRRQMIVKRIASLAGVEESTVSGAIRRASAFHAKSSARAAQPSEAPSGDDSAIADADPAAFDRDSAAHALACLFAQPELRARLVGEARDILDSRAYAPGPVRELARALRMDTHGAETESLGPASTTGSWLERIGDESARRLAAGLIGRITRETDGDPERLEAHFHECVRRANMERAMRLSSPASTVQDAPSGEATPDSVVARIEARRQLMTRFGQDPLAHAAGVGSGGVG